MADVFRQEYKQLTDNQKEAMKIIKVEAQKLYTFFDCLMDADPRMLALAKTNLEQSIMWAIKAIT